LLATLIPSHTGFSSSFRSHAPRNDRPPQCTHCIHGGLEWVATWLVLAYIMCCGTARGCVTATISARDSKYRFRTHIPLVDRGTPPGPTAEILPCCSITAHAAASNARHGSFAQRLARSSQHKRHPPRTLCRLCTMRLAWFARNRKQGQRRNPASKSPSWRASVHCFSQVAGESVKRDTDVTKPWRLGWLAGLE
jgi:hypothetical protein